MITEAAIKAEGFNLELKLNMLDKSKIPRMSTILKTCSNALEGHGYKIYAEHYENRILIKSDRETFPSKRKEEVNKINPLEYNEEQLLTLIKWALKCRIDFSVAWEEDSRILVGEPVKDPYPGKVIYKEEEK